jgi:hypothetical protein
MENGRETLVLDERALFGALGTSGVRSLTRLAREIARSGSWVNHMRAGIVPKPEDRKRIAEVLGVAEATLWKRAVIR